jgi:hypothetical protein
MHFGLGPRQCIGKTVATTNIYKLMSTLLAKFEFRLAADEGQNGEELRPGVPNMNSVGIIELDGPLLVTARAREKAKHKS